ncbi:MAG TPA: hypothetical protein VER17_20775 [Tepidisphaeraceae bacterium]|nr:hypothetical protein [Tepidisphaeraceae bacterium]
MSRTRINSFGTFLDTVDKTSSSETNSSGHSEICPEDRLLAEIRGGGKTVGQVIEGSGLPFAAAMRTIEKLEKYGFVKFSSRDDEKVIELTPSGLAVVK